MSRTVRPPRLQVRVNECGDEPAPRVGDQVVTACGGTVPYSPQAVCLEVEGETVYFCLEVCKADFQADPRHSCLAHRYK